MAMSPLEIRMAHLEGAYEQISQRLGTVEERLASLETRFEDRIARLEVEIKEQFVRLDQRVDGVRTELLSRMDRQFYWLISLVVLSILVPLFLRLLNP